MRRRDFIPLFGAVAAWPLAAKAQQAARKRLVGVVAGFSAAEMRPLLAAFRGKLGELGWADGDNLSIDTRLGGGDLKRMTDDTAGLVALNPEVILAQGTPGLTAVRRYTQSIPVVFILVADPVRMGLIKSLAQPGGHATGFTNFEFSIAGKWIELLRDLNPNLKHVTFIMNPANPNSGQFSNFIERSGRSLLLDTVTAVVRSPADIEAAIMAASQRPNGGLVIHPDSLFVVHRELIVGLAVRHRLAAIYPFRIFCESGGLISYGLDFPELYRQAATYVDRILRGERPGSLPVQAPNKFELVINLKTANALGLTITREFLLRADEVIE
jgi:putative ABC transport system substrate-binding protein